MKGRAQDRLHINTEEEFGPLDSKERRKNLQKNSQLQATYGITLRTYRLIHEQQKGLCAICKRPETGVHNRGRETIQLSLAVDHDHDTGAIRQLLCHFCNKALGLFNDDPDLLIAAADYLKAHKQPED